MKLWTLLLAVLVQLAALVVAGNVVRSCLC